MKIAQGLGLRGDLGFGVLEGVSVSGLGLFRV